MAPSRVDAGDRSTLHVRIEDRLGQSGALAAPADAVVDDRRAQRRALPPAGGGVDGKSLPDLAAGRHAAPRPSTAPALGLRCTSNPIECRSTIRSREPVYWGDLHAQSVIGCGARSIDAYYAHARDFAAHRCLLAPGELLPGVHAGVGGDAAQQHASTSTLPRASSRCSASSGRRASAWAATTTSTSRATRRAAPLQPRVRAPTSPMPRPTCRTSTTCYRHYRGSDTLVAVHVGGRTADLALARPGPRPAARGALDARDVGMVPVRRAASAAIGWA